jgi:chromosome segregation ATPase
MTEKQIDKDKAIAELKQKLGDTRKRHEFLQKSLNEMQLKYNGLKKKFESIRKKIKMYKNR